MGQFDENSELEKVLRIVKNHNISFDEICEKAGINRGRFNNIRRLHNGVHKAMLIETIKKNYPSVNFEAVKEPGVAQTYKDMFVEHLLTENKRLKEQIDLLIKKLLGDS
jgi:hypothetical protein